MAYSMQTLKVLAAMLEDQSGQHFGYDLMKQTKLLSGSMYPILARLENDRILTSAIEEIDPKVEGRRARRYYTLTGQGIKVARDQLREAQTALQPRLAGM
jgi:PadR family transcriptional regulator, regulatory protein PadR